MRQRSIRPLLFGAVVALYLLHNDFWFWRSTARVLGLPAGFLYHMLFCLAASVLMALLIRHAWPETDEAPPP